MNPQSVFDRRINLFLADKMKCLAEARRKEDNHRATIGVLTPDDRRRYADEYVDCVNNAEKN